MNPLQRELLRGYYWASLPYRRLCLNRAVRLGRAPVMILFYHRVADQHPNPWTMPTRTFIRQLDWLQRHADLVSLEEAQRRIRSGRNRRLTVSITFDDGYADNSEVALPELILRRIPCTYFVTLDHIRTGEPFPHDARRGIPLAPNSLEELQALSAAGIEIGAHTRTHPDLGQIDNVERVYDEVVTASRELEAETGQPIRYFAFPFGLHRNLNPLAFQLAREAGLEAVCSAYGGYNLPGDDGFHLQRFHADPEMVRFRNWLSFDPRKLRVPRYVPQPVPESVVAGVRS